MRVQLTGHAVGRYQARIAPHLTQVAAEAALREGITAATPERTRTHKGQLRYRLPDCIAIVKETKDRGLLVVTVIELPRQDAGWTQFLAEYMEQKC